MTRIFLPFLSVFILLMSVINTQAQEMPDPNIKHVLMRVFADQNAVVPGQTLRLAIEQTIAPGWHTYWINPGDSGDAMRIKWDLPKGYEVSDFLWPAPERVPYGPLVNFGYHERAIILTDVKIPDTARIGETVNIHGKVLVLVCDEICIPEDHEIDLSLVVSDTSTPANEDMFSYAAQQIPEVKDWHTLTEYTADEVRVRITLPEDQDFVEAGEDLHDVSWFPYEWGYVENAADQYASFEGTGRTLTLRQKSTSGRNLGDIGLAPYLIKRGDQSFIVGGPIKTMSVASSVPGLGLPGTLSTDVSLITILAFAFLGGIILNLMPCVFPVLSMKALHLVNLPREERTHARLHGVSYMLGIVAMFLALAGILFMIRAGGEQIGWGFQLQNPAIVALLAWLMFVIGLNLSGVFDFSVAFGGEMLVAERHHPIVTSFLTGVLATLVATPCSAPFMATALGVAMVQSVPLMLMIFAMLGFGLAFPYLLLCFVPTLQKILPKPGAWMVIFRQALAFPMFISAVWLVWVVAQQGGANAVAWTLVGMVMLAFAIWLIDLRKAQKIMTVFGVAVIVLTLGTLVMLRPVTAVHDIDETNTTQHWEAFNTKSYDYALNESDDPIFVNMTAAWCITCLVNERVVLAQDEAKTLFEQNKITYLKGDWTNRDASITAYLRRYGRSGVPIYVYYGARDADTGQRPSPVVLPQILTMQTLNNLIE